VDAQAVWEGALRRIGRDVASEGGGAGGGFGVVARSGSVDAGDGDATYVGVGEAAELWMIWLARARQR
jgi:hypothetical protein